MRENVAFSCPLGMDAVRSVRWSPVAVPERGRTSWDLRAEEYGERPGTDG